ncbi:hypothetical protein PV327_008731 [Microctonus hyperodae]|uniref:Uncharacterized protein n=1 Tax=Microctonus hyperodae TaxID=165561 RepID=A0AA39FSR6_MICHY|nr:hypothetical protein PV327_008731 [Microctonus hyperodae]
MDSSFFLQIPIIHQLQSLFLKSDFAEGLNYRFNREQPANCFSDIYDRRLYNNHTGANGLLNNRNNISFMFYVDGAPVFKSSKCKVWPIYLINNELPYCKRTLKENIIFFFPNFGNTHIYPFKFLSPQNFKNFLSVVTISVQTGANYACKWEKGIWSYEAE